MIKIILKSSILLALLIPNISNAAWSCLIKDNTALFLFDYISDNRQIVKNIWDAITKYNKEKAKEEKEKANNENWVDIIWTNQDRIKKDYDIAKNETTSILSQMFNFNWYYSYFNYYVTFPISNEVPYQVKRDYKILKDEIDWLYSYLETIDKQWYTNVVVENACKWMENCELNWQTTKEVMKVLLQNMDKILDFYRLTVTWEDNDYSLSDFELVDNNFIINMKKYYWLNSVNLCNQDEWWFFEQISKKISEITILTKEWKDWIQKWKDAIALIRWENKEKELEIERKKLKEYLSSQWVSAEKQEVMLQKLDEYNKNWFSTNNNFIANTISSTMTDLNKKLKKWHEEVIWDFFDKQPEKTKLEIGEVMVVKENSTISKNIKDRIAELYETEIPFAAIWDTATEKLRARIIDTHLYLDSSIKTLENTIKISQKVCKDQDKWSWKCE